MFLEARFERLVEKLSKKASIPLRLKLWTGRSIDLAPNPPVTVTIPRASALRYFLSPDLNGLGEAYVEGRIHVEGAAYDVFRAAECLARNAASAGSQGLKRFVRHGKNLDRKAIEYHYDVSNDFYRLFLDPNMVYSCAYYRNEDNTLQAAQEQKLDHILNKLMLRPGERLLDIGCGWGALISARRKSMGRLPPGSRYRRTNMNSPGSALPRRAWKHAVRCACRTIAMFRRRAHSTKSRVSACSSMSG